MLPGNLLKFLNSGPSVTHFMRLNGPADHSSTPKRVAVSRENPEIVRPVNLSPRELIRAWVDAFNRADPDALAQFYHENAVNHQVPEGPVVGRAAIREMFAAGFAAAKMVCIVENLFQDGNFAILEWRDPTGLRGCGFFHVLDGKIAFQRGYWDKLTFLRLQRLPIPRE